MSAGPPRPRGVQESAENETGCGTDSIVAREGCLGIALPCEKRKSGTEEIQVIPAREGDAQAR